MNNIMDENLKFINLTYLNSMSGGSQEIMKEMVEIFLEQLPEFRKGMKKAIETKDWKLLSDVAHKAKSSMAILGINELRQRLADLEISIKESKQQETYPSEVEYFLKISNEVEAEITALL